MLVVKYTRGFSNKSELKHAVVFQSVTEMQKKPSPDLAFRIFLAPVRVFALISFCKSKGFWASLKCLNVQLHEVVLHGAVIKLICLSDACI